MVSVPLFGMKERQPTADEKALIDDVVQLCKSLSLISALLPLVVWHADNVDQLKPISSAYARYAPNATFHDPIGLANGLEAVVSLVIY